MNHSQSKPKPAKHISSSSSSQASQRPRSGVLSGETSPINRHVVPDAGFGPHRDPGRVPVGSFSGQLRAVFRWLHPIPVSSVPVRSCLLVAVLVTATLSSLSRAVFHSTPAALIPPAVAAVLWVLVCIWSLSTNLDAWKHASRLMKTTSLRSAPLGACFLLLSCARWLVLPSVAALAFFSVRLDPTFALPWVFLGLSAASGMHFLRPR